MTPVTRTLCLLLASVALAACNRQGPQVPKPVDDNTNAQSGLTIAVPVLANDSVPADVADLDALQAWLRSNETRVPDVLDLFAAIDEVRGDPACAPCRQRLRALLWSASAQPPAQVPRRGAVDDAGRRYLDALRQEPAR